MANKVTSDDILRINEIYYKTKVYAETARQTGFSTSTVKKYVIKDWKPVVTENVIKFELKQIPEFDSSIFKNINNYGELCVLTEQEKEEMKELWRELAV